MGQTWDETDGPDAGSTSGPFGGPVPPYVPPAKAARPKADPRTEPTPSSGLSTDDAPTRSSSGSGSGTGSRSTSGEFFPAGPPEPGKVWLGKFDVVRRLGQGAMGEVWLVRHRELGVDRAVKLISLGARYDPEMRARFRREARAMARFSHPNAVAVHDASTSRDIAYIEMEYVVGRSLDRVLVHGEPMPLDWTTRILVQLCEALQAAHEGGIVHRDIKPSNMMLVDGRPEGGEFLKVLDFGIAKILDAPTAEGEDVQTRLGAAIGTLAYMSPEQVNGDPSKIDARTDLYAVGVFLYELLTGSRPFTSPGIRLTYDHLFTPPPPFFDTNPDADAPPEVEAVVLRCLEKDPDRRPQSARELAQAFLKAASPPAPEPLVAAGPSTSRRALLLAAVAAASSAGGLAAWFARRTPQAPRPPLVVALEAGGEATVPIPVGPDEAAADAVAVEGKLPDGLDVTRVAEGAETGVAPFKFRANLNTDCSSKEPKEVAFRIRSARGTSRVETVKVSMTLPPVAPLPPGFRALEPVFEYVGRDVYPRRIARVLPDGNRVEFLLVGRGDSGGPPSFYIMRDKVWVGLYKLFAAERPELTQAVLPPGDDRLPMGGVTVREAYEFALWLGGQPPHDKGGEGRASEGRRLLANLPTADQWEKAAGRYDRGTRQGPYREDWTGAKGQIAVDRTQEEGQMPVGAATHDVSWCGCRDMAGNGLEWTRTPVDRANPFPPPPGAKFAMEQRGKHFDGTEPLSFEELERSDNFAQFSDARDPVLGFRVVLDIL